MCSIHIHAQKKSLRFQHYTTEHGLPQNMVDCILQDSKGFMWFGTWNGLCRFDGYSFKVYREQIKEYSTISNNFIYSLCEDANGNLWVGTDEGLNVYIYDKDIFRRQSKDSLQQQINRVQISSIVNGKDSSIWIGSNLGVFKLKINNESEIIDIKYYPFGIKNSELLGRKVNHLMFDSKNKLWASTDNGICVLKSGEDKFEKIQNDPYNPNTIPQNSVLCTFEDSEGLIWIGTENGVSKYSPVTNLFTNYSQNINIPGSLVHNSVLSITEDVNGKIIIGTLGGISVYKKDDSETFFNYVENPNSESDLNNNFINCVYTDKWGNVWIGTERGGINKYNSAKKEFEYFEMEAGNENALNNNTINSIYEDEKYIWIGTAGGGLNRYTKGTGRFKHYFAKPNSSGGIANDFVTAIVRDNKNNLWVGTWGGGLHKLINEGLTTETFINFRAILEGNTIVNDYISSIIPAKNGDLWIGTLGGLDRFNEQNSLFEHINYNVLGIDLFEIGCIELDHHENLWIGTKTGLHKLIINENQADSSPAFKILSFKHEVERKNSLSGDYVLSVFEDSNENIWIGTYGFGLNKLVSEDNGGVFNSYSTNHGLPNNIIFTILEDLFGNLWMTTDYGLSKFIVKEKKFRNFFVADGLQNNQYYWSASFINNSGKLYFGGMNGLNTFYPDWISDNVTKSHVVLTDFRIVNESVLPGKEYGGKIAIQESINTSKQITLTYKSRDFSFEFSALDYEQPALNQYAYRLLGFDNNWKEVTANRRFAYYTNLKPGDYKFQVKAKNSHGEWLEPTNEIDVNITPPLWATWWFRLSMILFVISLVIFYNRYRVYALKVQKVTLEKQVRERTKEIEKQTEKLEEKNIQLAYRQELIEGQKDKLEIQNEQILKQRNKLLELNKRVKLINQLKLRFFTNISHEFRTPLTLILGPLEKLLTNENNFDSDTQKSLSLINRNAQRLLQLINQLMDFRKLEQGKMKLAVSNVNIIAFLSNIVSSFSVLAEQKKIAFEFIPDNINSETWFDFRKLENVIYNLLSNAFKYTPKEGRIWVKLYKSKPEDKNNIPKLDQDHLIIEIGDTGNGIDEQSLSHIFDRFYQIESDSITSGLNGTGIGLSLTKELVETHNGDIKVKSKEGVGTVFYVHLPYKKENFQSESITKLEYDPTSIQKQASIIANELAADNDAGYAANLKQISIKGCPVILIAEDNKDLREFVASKLRSDYNIIEAENGRIGYEMATLNNPDIIISDIMMPEMDGLEFCSRIKSNLVTSHIPVILLTAKGSIESQIEGLEIGADIYLPKPFNFRLLDAHIKSLLESRKKLYEAFRVKTKIDAEDIATTSLDDKFMNSLLKIIEDNIENPELNINLLLEHLSISRSLLHRKITTLTNMSTVEFITNIRLKKSVDMLKNLDFNISEVAYSVGFNDPKYFSRIFRKQFGKSPSDYQKDISQSN